MGFSLSGLIRNGVQDVQHAFNGARTPAPRQQAVATLPSPGQAGYGVVRPGAPVMSQSHPPQNGLYHAVQQTGKGFGMGLEHVGLGIGQGLSGLADLATPGTGQSRVTQGLNHAQDSLSQRAKRLEGPAHSGYNIGNVSGTVGSFLLPTELAKGASMIPKVANAVDHAAPVINAGTRLMNPVTKAIQGVAERGAAGRIAAAGLNGIASPAGILNAAGGTALQLGHMSGQGEKITPVKAVETGALNAGASLALPAGAKALEEGGRAVVPALKAIDSTVKSGAVKQAANDGIAATQRQLDRQHAALQTQLRNTPVTNTIANNNLAAKIDRNRFQYNALEAQKQKLTAGERVATTPIGMSTKPVKVADVPSTTPELALSDAAKPAPQTPANKLPQLKGEASQVKNAPLPEYGTKQVSGKDRAFRSTRSIIERQGEHGQKLAGMLQGSRDTQEIYQAQLAKQLPTVRSLKGKDFENFVETTQGKAQAASPKIEQAIKEWQSVHPGIRDRAVKAGLDVGDLGPSYYPHFIDYQKIFKDKNMKNTAINHLVETGQAKTAEEALGLLSHAKDVSRNRSFGNLEAQRLIDLPMYDKTPNSLVSYLSSSAKRIAQTETFGAKDEKALKLITKAAAQGHDTEAMKNAYDVAVGAKRYGETATNFSNKARAFQSTTRLGLGALTNTSQNINTGIVTGHMNTLRAMAKQLSPKVRSFVADTGVIGDAVLNDIKTQGGFTGKVLGKITAPGFGKVESFNRSVAATAGRDYALRLAQKGDEKTLRRLGVQGDITGRTLTEAQQVQAARKVVEKTQFKVDAQDLPGWADSPGGKLVAQFRTFSYSQGKFVSNEILKPAAKGNFLPLGRLLAALPLGYGLYEAKRRINGRPEEQNKTKLGLQAFQNVGGAGLAFDIYQSLNPTNSQYLPADRRISMGVSTLGGPTAGLATQLMGATSDLIQRKNTPADPSRMQGKVAIANNGTTYIDATQAARLALNQIPVIGSPIRNRVLPYKSATLADTGTRPSSNGSSTTSSGGKPVSNPGMNSPEAKAFLKLNPADQRAAAASDPNARALYDQLAAIKKGMTPSALRPEGTPPEAAKILDRYDRLTASGKAQVFDRKNGAEAEYNVAKYAQDKASGKLTRSQDIRAQASLAKDRVGADYSKSTRDLYGLSKPEVYNLVTTDPNGKKIADDLLAYGDALQKNGIENNKFRTLRTGAVAFAPKTTVGQGAGKGASNASIASAFSNRTSGGIKAQQSLRSIAMKASMGKTRSSAPKSSSPRLKTYTVKGGTTTARSRKAFA